MAATAGQIWDWIEELAPSFLAEEWDNVGLQCGTFAKETKKALTALTVTSDVVDQAISGGYDLIVAHHPLIFRPLSRIDASSPQGEILHRLIGARLTCIAAHTNLDAAPLGVNEGLARRLSLSDTAVLSPSAAAKVDKLVTFVPAAHVDAVRNALASAGAGEIGEYTHCTFGVSGIGTFVPSARAEPFTGKRGSLSRVEEVRLEVVLPRRVRSEAVARLVRAHPYEEVPIDIYPLEEALDVRSGIGRIGKLPRPMGAKEFLEHVQKSLELSELRVAGALPESVETVAVLGGSGGSFVNRAALLGADALITGDVDYHDADLARSLGLLVVDAGHFGTERHVPVDLATYLTGRADQEGVELHVDVARERDAFIR